MCVKANKLSVNTICPDVTRVVRLIFSYPVTAFVALLSLSTVESLFVERRFQKTEAPGTPEAMSTWAKVTTSLE